MSFCCSLGWVRPLPDRTASPHAAGRRGAATELIEQSLSLVGAGGRGEHTYLHTPVVLMGGALLYSQLTVAVECCLPAASTAVDFSTSSSSGGGVGG